jgi:hypothetical protein
VVLAVSNLEETLAFLQRIEPTVVEPSYEAPALFGGFHIR